MRILWITNMLFPEAAQQIGIQAGVSGGWMFDLANGIANTPEIELFIATTYSGKDFQKISVNKKTYYLMPGGGHSLLTYDKKLIPYWKQIESECNPDIVHLHGTEYKHGLVYMDTFPNKNFLLTIQGIMEPITREYYAGMKFKDILQCMTFKEFLRGKSLISLKYLAASRAKSEKEIVQRVNYLTGRSDWDKAILAEINPTAKYFRCNYNLRPEFYTAPKWDIEKSRHHTIYGSTALQTSYKGGETLIKAIALVKRRYPDVKVKALLPGSVNGKFKITSGYTKFVKHLLDKYDLWENFEFIPSLSAQEVIDTMLSCRCVVVPSAMENASSTLREAMHLGVPSIAAFRGGMTHLINDGVNGFFFDYPEYPVLAMRIMELFENNKLCKDFSQNAIQKAESWHNREANVSSLYTVYKEIYTSKKA